MINYDYLELNYVLVVYDIKDSVFSSFLLFYTTQTERFVTKLCTFIIRNYIYMYTIVAFNQIHRNSVLSNFLISKLRN